MQIKVRTLTGKEIELDIERDYKVSTIKEKVEEKEGIPPVQQRLIFGGKQMEPVQRAHQGASQGEGDNHTEEMKKDNRADQSLYDHRADDKTADDYSLTGGATLHLVLALRGGKQ